MADFKISASYKDFDAMRKDPVTHQLAVLFQPEGLQYSIMEIRHNRLIALEEYDSVKPLTRGADLFEDLEELLDRCEWAHQPWGRVIAGIENQWVTLVPPDLFEEAKVASYLGLVHDLPDGLSYHSELMPSAGIRCIHAVLPSLEALISRTFPSAVTHHYSACLVDSLASATRPGNEGYQAYVQAGKKSLDIVIFREGQLLFYNIFPFRDPEDFIYFILFVLDQLHIQPDECNMTLLGGIEPNSEAFRRLGEYISRPGFMTDDRRLRFSQMLSKMPYHRFYNLTHLHLCE